MSTSGPRPESNGHGRRNGRSRPRKAGQVHETTSPPEPLPDFLSEMMRLLGGGPPPAPGATRAKKRRVDAPAGGSELLQILGRAWLVYVASGLRYWSRMADAWAKTLPSVTRAVAAGQASGTPSEAHAVLLDELRARLRDLVDVPSQEARLLQAELDRIAGELWPRPPDKGEARYWRRWETKP